MNILMYRGSFQYGVVDLFITNMIQALKQKQHSVKEINLNDANASQNIMTIFSKEAFDCVIGVGGIGSTIKLDNGQSIYDAVNTNYLAIYIDHPAHLMNRVVEPIKNHLVSFIDKSHVDYINEVLPQNHKLNFFLPHGAMNIQNSKKMLVEKYQKEKTIDILFSGTFMGVPKKPWEGIDNFPSEVFDEVCEILINNDYKGIHEVFDQICEKRKIKFSTISKAQLASLMVNIITYIRQYKRYILIEKLAKSGLNITICGKNWNDFVKKYPNIDYKGPLDIRETLKLMQQAKIVVNATPNFSHGSHERVFTAMLHQAVVFSDRSSYLDEYFKDEEEILYYSMQSLDADIEKLKTSLSDDNLYEIASKAYDITLKNHTWSNRVDTILQMIILSKAMDS
jgi:hypothetical protein